MAEPAGPVTFKCPLAVRSTCPPARCTAAAISLASLDRQRFGVGCFFSAIPDDLRIPRTRPWPYRGQRTFCWQAPGQQTASRSDTPSSSGHVRRIFTLGPCWVRTAGSTADNSGQERSPDVRRTCRPLPLQLRDLVRSRRPQWSSSLPTRVVMILGGLPQFASAAPPALLRPRLVAPARPAPAPGTCEPLARRQPIVGAWPR
jgi:hypothetical protein